MKKQYIKPELELFRYKPEEGFSASMQVALHKDYVLVEGDDHSILRSADEVTEYTDASGEYQIGGWE